MIKVYRKKLTKNLKIKKRRRKKERRKKEK
jgi:hypothetical protein